MCFSYCVCGCQYQCIWLPGKTHVWLEILLHICQVSACSLIHSSYSFVGDVADGGIVKMEMMDDDNQSVISAGSLSFQSHVMMLCVDSVDGICAWW